MLLSYFLLFHPHSHSHSHIHTLSKVEDKIQESDELKKEIADVKCIL